MSQITRIVSDVHFGHKASYVRDLSQLAPLLEGADRVIFNGDSVEMRFLEEREQAGLDAALFRTWCAHTGIEAVFVTGNHDPFLTDIDHVELADGSVLITHGDILFRGVSPWSAESGTLVRAHTREIEALGDCADFELYLRAAKRTMLAVEHLGPKMRHAGRSTALLTSFLHEIWPPWRPLRILGCWLRTPRRANAVVAQFRPQARFAIIGHLHWAGIWPMKDRVVINTGSFLPFSRRYAVDIVEESGEVVVWNVVGRRKEFRLGTEAARFALDYPAKRVAV